MKPTRLKLILLALAILVLAAFAYQGVQRIATLYVQTLRVTNSGEFQGTNTFSGDTTITGAVNQSGLQTLTGGLSVAPNVVIAAPTALATATPALYVNSAGAHNLVVISKAATPIFTIGNGGAITENGGSTNNSNVVVSAPTAIATATPAAYINNAGAHNSLVIAKNATPNFTVGNAGVVTGQVLQYATSGQRQFCATNTITDTASYTSSVTAVATPVFTWCSMNAVTGDAEGCAASHATGSVTVIVRNSNATPAANAVGAAVTWCVVGTP